MNRLITYCFLLIGVLTACEEIYIPEIETRDNVLVADARIVVGNDNNYIRLNESRSFNDVNNNFSGIKGATVAIIDNNSNRFELPEESDGLFSVNFQLNPEREYKIEINYRDDRYESSFEPVPKIPHLDSVYGIPENKVIEVAGSTNVNDFRKKAGIQLYADIKGENELPFFRFSGRKILQYTYTVDLMVMGELIPYIVYGWYSFYSQESYNIAAPPEYSNTSDIIKHPIYFLEEKALLARDQTFAGWILILYQYGLSKSGYNYYKDLNNQLDSEGRLFDPLYVQARSNITCTNNKNQLILGNFEISTVKEYRYFVKYVSPKIGYIIKPIPYFYEIPQYGEQLSEQPEFWEYDSKKYPDE